MNTALPTALTGITEHKDSGLVVLSPNDRKPRRRVLFVNSYGGAEAWAKVKGGLLPPHHLWGCIELVRLGYEVALAEPLRHFNHRRPLPHDWPLLRFARSWLRHDDVIYCGHTLLFWLPLLKQLRLLKCRLISLTYAREELDFCRAHDGILALTPAAMAKAESMAPKAKVHHIGWGVDLGFFPVLPLEGQWLLSCGRTHRDHETLHEAAMSSRAPLRIIAPSLPPQLKWPETTVTTTGGKADDTVPYRELLLDYYRNCGGSLIILNEDPQEKHAVGFTNMIEAMAMARPIIMTRTGALATEMNVEAAGCGLNVPPRDPAALANAMTWLLAHPQEARSMGAAGRKRCETHYNMNRFSSDLFRFIENL